MSILLDALRKSEQRERLGAAPDIHSADPGIDTSGPGGRRGAVLAILVLIILSLCVYGGWRWWSDRQTPVAAPEFSDASQAETSAQSVSPAGGTTNQASSASPSMTERQAPERTATNEEEGSVGEVATGPAPPRLDRQPRSPVEQLSGDRPYRPAAGQARAPSSTTSTPTAPARSIPQISDKDLEAAASQAEAAANERARRRAAASSAPEQREGRGSQRPAANPDEGLISFWQLPQNLRDGLPELKINVMVFDEEPSRRFLIMGGKRYGEGSEVSSDLTLEEVRRDQAVFRYGAYRFFIRQ